jgi:class 3 adenylate cyclase
VASGLARDAEQPLEARLRANLLGWFGITLADRRVDRWPRPSAKRLCELVMLSPGCRIGREVACELLFGNLSPGAAANALSRALSMARGGLRPLGEGAPKLLQADRAHIWLSQEVPVEIDLVVHEAALRGALSMAPGARDAALCSVLSEERTLLEDEPYADWAIRPREALELLRQRARLELARDRTRGLGRAQPAGVVEAWENCLSHDPASEEAASALVRVYTAAGQLGLASGAYERCRAALEELGLRPSPALEEARRAIAGARPAAGGPGPTGTASSARLRQEQRLVSVLFAQVSALTGAGQRLGPEELRGAVEDALAAVVADVEALGGTVTSLSGAGLVALFGAPAAYEDDPERAVRAGYRALSSVSRAVQVAGRQELSVRIGIETGRAVVGPLRVGTASSYEAVGEVVTFAAAVQSAASGGAVLVGPATRAATEGIFEWGPSEEVVPSSGAKPLTCWYVDRPRPRRSGYHPRRARREARLVGRRRELSALEEGLRAATAGQGSVAFLVGAPGLGKTRLVQECRKRFMVWVGAGTGRLPLWLEGYGASYTSSVPYGLYQQLLICEGTPGQEGLVFLKRPNLKGPQIRRETGWVVGWRSRRTAAGVKMERPQA